MTRGVVGAIGILALGIPLLGLARHLLRLGLGLGDGFLVCRLPGGRVIVRGGRPFSNS